MDGHWQRGGLQPSRVSVLRLPPRAGVGCALLLLREEWRVGLRLRRYGSSCLEVGWVRKVVELDLMDLGMGHLGRH